MQKEEKYVQHGARLELSYFRGSHLAEDVPEAKRFVSGSRHDGLAVGGHGLQRNASEHAEQRGSD